MPYFVVHALDRPGVLARRTELRPSHRARLRQHDHPVTVRIGGPMLDAAGAMTGTLLIIEASSIGAVKRYLASDPYVLDDLFASVDIREFSWGLGTPVVHHG